jgi:hypothetical protein
MLAEELQLQLVGPPVAIRGAAASKKLNGLFGFSRDGIGSHGLLLL